jgi:hypothetical protein
MDPECARPDSPVTTRPALFSRASSLPLPFIRICSSPASTANSATRPSVSLRKCGSLRRGRCGMSTVVGKPWRASRGAPSCQPSAGREGAKRRWRSATRAPIRASACDGRLEPERQSTSSLQQHRFADTPPHPSHCSSIVGRPRHQGVMVGMGQKDSYVGCVVPLSPSLSASGRRR